MAASMRQVNRLQSRLKSLTSLNIQTHRRLYLPTSLNKNECFLSSKKKCNLKISRPFFTATVSCTLAVHDDQKVAPVKLGTEAEQLRKYKEVVTSNTLTLVLPDIEEGTTVDELHGFFSKYGSVEEAIVEEKSIQAHVSMKDRSDAVKLFNMKEANFNNRVIKFSKSSGENDDVVSRTVVIENLTPSTEKLDLMSFLNAFEIEACKLTQERSDIGYIKFNTPEEAEVFCMQIMPDFEIKRKNLQFDIEPNKPNVICVQNLDSSITAQELSLACRNFVPSRELPECWRPKLFKGLVKIKFMDLTDAQTFFEQKKNYIKFKNESLNIQVTETKMLQLEDKVVSTGEEETICVSHHKVGQRVYQFSYDTCGLPYSSRVLVKPTETTNLYIESEGVSFDAARNNAITKAKHFWSHINKGSEVTEDVLRQVFSDASKVKLTVHEDGFRNGHVLFLGKVPDKDQKVGENDERS